MNNEDKTGVMMTWEYALIGLVIGIIIGMVAMRFGNKKLREQSSLKYELKKSKAELADYREELTNHFAHSAELLDNITQEYRQLYQHMAKGSKDLLPNLPGEKNPFAYHFIESEADNDQLPIEIPRDYPNNASGFLRGERVTR